MTGRSESRRQRATHSSPLPTAAIVPRLASASPCPGRRREVKLGERLRLCEAVSEQPPCSSPPADVLPVISPPSPPLPPRRPPPLQACRLRRVPTRSRASRVSFLPWPPPHP